MLRWQPTAAATSTARRPSAKSRRASNRLDCAIRFPIQLLTHELMAAWTPTWCNDRLKPPTSQVVLCTRLWCLRHCGGLEELEPAARRIEPHASAERHHHVLLPMADRKAGGTGQPCLLRERAKHVGAGVARILFLAAGEVAEREPNYLLENARQPKVRPHPVQPVRPFADVLEHQDRAFQ